MATDTWRTYPIGYKGEWLHDADEWRREPGKTL